MQVSALEEQGGKKRPEQVCKEGVIFSTQQGAIMQNQSSLLTRIKEKSESRARG